MIPLSAVFVEDQTIEESDDWYNNNRNHHINMEDSKMIIAEFTREEVQSGTAPRFFGPIRMFIVSVKNKFP